MNNVLQYVNDDLNALFRQGHQCVVDNAFYVDN